MNTDIRILISFKGHRKRKKLKMLLGPGSTDYLIDLWISVALNRPEGVLTGWDETDIAIEAGYEDDADKFVQALVKSGWLDKDKKSGTYTVHNWADRQSWASGAKLRSENARKAAHKRWNKEPDQVEKPMPEQCETDAGAMPEQCGKDAGAMRDACGAQCETDAGGNAPILSLPNQDKAFNTNVLKATPGRRHFKNLYCGKIVEKIIDHCEAITKLPQIHNGQKFNPFQWVQFHANKQTHPDAVRETVAALANPKYWQTIKTGPWNYANSIVKTKNGNYNEREHIKAAEQFKNLWVDPEIQKVINDIGT